jgi:hypothetical protein
MIYCEPKPDEAILGEVAGSKKVFLLGCSLCANISYCVHNRLHSPIYSFDNVDQNLGLAAVIEGAVNLKHEIKRLKQVLSEQGVHTGSVALPSLCCIRREHQQAVIRATDEYETVVTLSCENGSQNVEDFLKGKRVVGAMKNKGLMRSTMDQDGLTFRFDQDRLYINNKKYSG